MMIFGCFSSNYELVVLVVQFRSFGLSCDGGESNLAPNLKRVQNT